MRSRNIQVRDYHLEAIFKWIAVISLSVLVVSAFLSHWSLLDGAPRNSLKMFMDGQAHRPFAYRILGPKIVSGVDGMLPLSAQKFLENEVALYSNSSNLQYDCSSH